MRADILACWSNNIISRIIRLITRQKVSHVALMFTDDLVAQSLWRGVKIDKIEDMKSNYYILRYEGLSWKQKDSIIKFLRDSIDIKYDYIQLIEIGLHKLFHTHINNNTSKYICSELVYDAFRSINIDIAPHIQDKNSITPGDLLESKVLRQIQLFIK